MRQILLSAGPRLVAGTNLVRRLQKSCIQEGLSHSVTCPLEQPCWQIKNSWFTRGLVCLEGKFTAESIGEIFLKIGQYLAKLWTRLQSLPCWLSASDKQTWNYKCTFCVYHKRAVVNLLLYRRLLLRQLLVYHVCSCYSTVARCLYNCDLNALITNKHQQQVMSM